MKKIIILIILTTYCIPIYAQKSEFQVLISSCKLGLSYPKNDIYRNLRKSNNENMNNHIAGLIAYQYRFSKMFGIFADMSVYGNRYNENSLKNNYFTNGNSESYVTSFSIDIGLTNRFKIYQELKLNTSYGIVTQFTEGTVTYFDSGINNRVLVYNVSKSSGFGYKLKFDLQFPFFNTKSYFILGYHINNTFLKHNISAVIKEGWSYETISYPTVLSYFYQNFCIGIQF